MPVLVIKERMRVKCDACFRGVPSLADWVAALMSPSPLLGVGSSPGCKEGSVRALSAGWALGLSSHRDGNQQRLPTQRAAAQPSPLRAEQSAPLAGHSSICGSGWSRKGWHIPLSHASDSFSLTSQPALIPQVGGFSLFCTEPKAPSPLQP